MPEEKDLTTDARIQTVSGLMASIEDEIAAIKSGDMKETTGRLVFRGRSLQMQAVGHFLAAARMEARLRPNLIKRMGDGAKVIDAPKEKEEAT